MAEQVLEPDGTLWKPRPGATASAQEFADSRAFIIAIHREESWNPWVVEDRAEELAVAKAVFEQWTRAEPGFRPKTATELDEWMKKRDEQFAAESERGKKERLARVRDFDEGRAAGRLQLLEREARLKHCTEEKAALVSGERFPAMPESKRAANIEELDTRITTLQRDVADLRDLVDDPETVVDQHGYLPADRREISRIGFMLWRQREIRRLRESVADLGKRLAVKGLDKAERAELRQKFNADRNELDKLLDVPPQSAADMCSECERPLSWHGYSRGSQPWCVCPCPAWPEWSQRIQKARDMLFGFADERHTPAPEPPKPTPLTVIPSGLPIAEVLNRLAEIQTKHPDAEVRRGARNKWEVWPAARPPQ